MARPKVSDTGIFNYLIRFLYSVDIPDNLFPSIHCVVCTLFMIAVMGEKRIPRWYKVCSYIMGVLIMLSTLTTKQHAVVDLVFGIALAIITYIFTSENIVNWYKNLVIKKLNFPHN